MMNHKSYPLIVRIHALAYVQTFKNLVKLVDFFRAVFAGFWLGILKRETLLLINKFYYEKNLISYCDEEHNRRGLWNWERKVIDKCFQGCKSLLVGAVGGGREVLGLHQLGYDVDGFDCHPEFVSCANERLKKEGVYTTIQLVPPDQCPIGHKIYDGIIIGWGAYTFIHGREQRIAFLKKLRVQTRAGAPILLSFFDLPENARRFKVIVTIGNAIRWMLRRNFLEIGDDLKSTYVHYFTREEIESELNEGGFDLTFYSTFQHGHAVGIASKKSDSMALTHNG